MSELIAQLEGLKNENQSLKITADAEQMKNSFEQETLEHKCEDI